MEPPSCTKKSEERAAEMEAAFATFKAQPPELDFPVDADFKPPHLDPVAMYWRCEQLARQGARGYDAKRRLAESIDVEFIL